MVNDIRYLSTPKAAAYVDACSINAFRKWVRKTGVPFFRFGREMRFLPSDLDWALGNQQRGFKSSSSRFQQSERPSHGAGVSQQAIRDVHASDSQRSASAVPLNALEPSRSESL